MKLILKEYLSSLKERNELDALLPTLLSQMGLTILSAPSIGNRQFGVDISAFGSINGAPKKVYLFSIKAGNLGRSDWDSGNAQDLRPSLNEIKDVYIPTHIPQELKSYPIEICLTFGGDLKQEIELNLSQYEQANQTDQIKFSRWSGDRIAGYLESFLINEQLFFKDEMKSILRKSLAMVDQPEVSFKIFCFLLNDLFNNLENQPLKYQLTTLRQSYLALGILNSWCISENNIESAYLSAERLILYSWDVVKSSITDSKADAKKIRTIFGSLVQLYLSISNSYYNKLLPHFDSLHAISNAIRGNCDVDINIKLFDIIGRIALYGIWVDWILDRTHRISPNEEIKQQALNTYRETVLAIKKLIIRNPLLFHPYKDEQAIDISLTAFYLLSDSDNDSDLQGWLAGITNSIYGAFLHNRKYLSNIHDYLDLVMHPIDDTEVYRSSVTKGSITYPLLGFFAEVFKDREIHVTLQKIYKEFTPQCTSQIWHPDPDSESHIYKDSEKHGLCVTGIRYETLDQAFNLIKDSCLLDKEIYDLSAIKYGYHPILLTACRHYRLPIPYHFLFDKLNIDISGQEDDLKMDKV